MALVFGIIMGSIFGVASGISRRLENILWGVWFGIIVFLLIFMTLTGYGKEAEAAVISGFIDIPNIVLFVIGFFTFKFIVKSITKDIINK